MSKAEEEEAVVVVVAEDERGQCRDRLSPCCTSQHLQALTNRFPPSQRQYPTMLQQGTLPRQITQRLRQHAECL
jgi:hypothetical protein